MCIPSAYDKQLKISKIKNPLADLEKIKSLSFCAINVFELWPFLKQSYFLVLLNYNTPNTTNITIIVINNYFCIIR